MKKSMVSLTLLLSLLATAGCAESAKSKTTKDENGNKVDVMYNYEEDDKVIDVTADDVYADLLDSTTGSKALFDAVYKKVVQSTIEEEDAERNKEIEKEVDEEMVTWLQDAKDQAADNGVSKDTMIDALLEEEGVDSPEELTEKKIYAKQKEYVEEEYFDNNRNEGLNLVHQYVSNYYPIHVKGILVKVADSNYNYFARSISEDESKKLARTTDALIKGKEFNLLAMDSKFSDHSTAQTDAGGDLGIMDVTTSFNSEYKLGIYTYFAYNDAPSAEAKTLLAGNDADLAAEYDRLYAGGFNVITLDQANNLKGAAELKKFANGDLVNTNTADGDYKSLNLPRNVVYNNYFNSHRVSLLQATAETPADKKVTVSCTKVGETEVVANKYGYPILVLTDENGVQFISVEMDAFGSNLAAAESYFGATKGEKVDVKLNNKDVSLTPYFNQGSNSDRNSRKETVDTQIKNYINKGFSSSVAANQEFYYYRIYNEFIGNVEGQTLNSERLTALYGENYAESKYYTQVTNYIKAIEDYREILINESREETGEDFSKVLALQDSYADWVRPEWLAYFDGYVAKDGTTISDAATSFNTANTNNVTTGYGSWVDYWNKNLGGGALYE